MRFISLMLAFIFLISCEDQSQNNKEVINTNPFLIGSWTGEGRFLDVDLANDLGMVFIKTEIKENGKIIGSIGDADLIRTKIRVAKFGFEIRGELSSKINRNSSFDKDHLIILLVLPEENRSEIISSEANFHLKSNYTFDAGMRVGSVILLKDLNL
jgi:hypothetical protein